MSVEERLTAAGLALPAAMRFPPGLRVNWRQVRVVGSRAIVAGHGPRAADGTPYGKPNGVEVVAEWDVRSLEALDSFLELVSRHRERKMLADCGGRGEFIARSGIITVRWKPLILLFFIAIGGAAFAASRQIPAGLARSIIAYAD